MAYFSQGLSTHKVPMSMHAEHREKIFSRFSALNLLQPSAAILLQGGKQLCHHDTDAELLFRQESFFQYLFGVSDPDCFGVLDLSKKSAVLFVPRFPPEYAVWKGEIVPLSDYKTKYEVDEIFYEDELASVLENHLKVDTLHVLSGTNSDSGSAIIEPSFPGIEKFKIERQYLLPELSECRVIKTKAEIELLRYTNRISSEAHIEVMRRCKPGLKEYQLESIFLHYTYFHGGCRFVSYVCICASGSNGAVLHYGHAGAPNDRTIGESDMCLFDMGAEYHCYTSDITCSFPSNGKFTDDQKAVFETVRAAQLAVFEKMKPGVSWPDMHLLAERTILEGCIKMGLVKGTIEELVNNLIGPLFMPHGLGHFMGLDTHDVGGYPAGVVRSTRPGLKSLRTGRVLQEGMVITVEPGLYFNKATLSKAFEDPSKAKFLNVDRIEQLFSFGGVRLEDDVLVTNDGCEVLTKCPRTVEEIEKIMRS